MRAAHEVGLKSNATMLYGHVETPAELADHMVRLRELQDDTGGFNAFIPLSFQPANTGLSELPGPTGFDDLKMLAVGRLVLDNFRHVKAFWINVGLKLAQVSLAFGVNDLDGTVVEEKISHAAGVDTGQELSKAELVRVIRAAGRVPVERDTLYNVVRRYDDALSRRRRAARGASSRARPVRVGRIEFVNCFPLYHHFEEELARARRRRRRSSRATRRRSTSMLVDGAIDVALPSSIAFARARRRAGAAAAGLHQLVRRRRLDPALHARAAATDVRRVALTEKSATSICLLKVLCREWGIEPEFAPRRGPLAEVLGDFDGLLLIGDEALHVLRAEVVPVPLRPRRGVAAASPACRWCTRCAPRGATSSAARPAAAAAVGAALLASRDALRRATPPRRPPPRRSLRLQPGATSWSTSTSSSSASRRSTAPGWRSSTGAPRPSASWTRVPDLERVAACGRRPCWRAVDEAVHACPARHLPAAHPRRLGARHGRHAVDWWGGRDLRPLLPKIFFEHFRGTSLVVEHEDELVAFLVGFLCRDHDDEAYVHFAGVHPAWRRVGLARDLYRRFFALARCAGRQRRARRHRAGQHGLDRLSHGARLLPACRATRGRRHAGAPWTRAARTTTSSTSSCASSREPPDE